MNKVFTYTLDGHQYTLEYSEIVEPSYRALMDKYPNGDCGVCRIARHCFMGEVFQLLYQFSDGVWGPIARTNNGEITSLTMHDIVLAEPGSAATVVNRGSSDFPILHFSIPRGASK